MMRLVQGIAKFFAFVQVFTLGISAGLSEEPAAAEAGKAASSVPYPFCKGKQWGYLNDQGKVVVKPQFRTADDFSRRLEPTLLENGVTPKWAP